MYLKIANPIAKTKNKVKPPAPLIKLLAFIMTAVGVGKGTPIPSYISANIGTTLINMNTITVMVFMLIKVVPIFAEMYEGMGVALPTPTAVIMNASNFMRGAGGLTLAIVCIIGFALFKYTTTKIPAVRYKWHNRVLKMPVFGDMILKSLIARISLIMGNLSSAGVNLLESIEIAKQVSNNDVVTQALENVKKGVFSGDTLTKLFLKEPVFPPTFSQLISVGEQTGNLDEMFTSVSAYYEEEFDTAVDNMSSLIEPIMIVFMGTMIGGLMIAMYSPIFNVGAIIGS